MNQSTGESGVKQHRYARRFFTFPVICALFAVLSFMTAFAEYRHENTDVAVLAVETLTGLVLAVGCVLTARTAMSVYETSVAGIRKAGSKRGWTAWNQIESVWLIEKSETSIIIMIVVSMLARRAAGGLGASSRTSRMVGAATTFSFAATDAMASKKITPGVKHRYFPRGRTWLWGGKYLRLGIKIPGEKRPMILLSQISEFDAILAYAAKAGGETDEVTVHNFQALDLLPGGGADAAAGAAAPQPA